MKWKLAVSANWMRDEQSQRPCAIPPFFGCELTPTGSRSAVLPRTGLRGIQRAAAAQEVGDQTGPAGLVRGADARPGVAVEVLVELQQVAPFRVVAELLDRAVHGPAAVGVRAARSRPAARRGRAATSRRRSRSPGAGRVLDREGLAERRRPSAAATR